MAFNEHPAFLVGPVFSGWVLLADHDDGAGVVAAVEAVVVVVVVRSRENMLSSHGTAACTRARSLNEIAETSAHRTTLRRILKSTKWCHPHKV